MRERYPTVVTHSLVFFLSFLSFDPFRPTTPQLALCRRPSSVVLPGTCPSLSSIKRASTAPPKDNTACAPELHIPIVLQSWSSSLDHRVHCERYTRYTLALASPGFLLQHYYDNQTSYNKTPQRKHVFVPAQQLSSQRKQLRREHRLAGEARRYLLTPASYVDPFPS